MKLDLVMAHHGSARFYDAVAAAAAAGYSLRYLASYYHDPNGLAGRLAEVVPGRPGARLRDQLGRRWHPRVPVDAVERSLLCELAVAAQYRWGLLGGGESRFALDVLDRWTARRVRALRPRLVMAPDGCALRAMAAAKGVGAVAVLDHGSGFIAAYDRVMRREAALHPDYAEAFSLPSADKIAYATTEARAADYVMAGSDFVRDSLAEAGVAPERVFVVPYTVDTDRFHPRAERAPGPFRVLFVGRISAAKGVRYLLDGFRAAALPDAELVLVGNMDPANGWLAPFEGRFRHVAHVPHHRVHELFQSADVFCFPSLYEGSAVCVYEALACGLPVITTPNAGSVVRHGTDGMIVPPQDSDAIAAALRRLYDDTALRRDMAAHARALALDYGWQAFGNRIATMLRGLLGPPGG